MSLLIQDGLVTLLTLGAAAMLVQRVFNVVRPRPVQRQCAGCNHCPAPAAPPQKRTPAT